MKLTLAVLFVCFAIAAAKVPLLRHDSPTRVPDQYLVVFHRNSTAQIRDLHVSELRTKRFSRKDETILGVFTIGNLIGYCARLSKETLEQELEHPNVRYVEADQEVHALDDISRQPNLPTGLWGLARVSSRLPQPLTPVYDYWTSSGTGVTAYVIDTGIEITHDDFKGRASYGGNFVTPVEPDPDRNGHGTHVAGTIGGVTYGVAKNVTLVAVKVLGASGSGTWAGVIQGIDYVTAAHQRTGTDARSVANMSLGGGATDTVDEAVILSVAAGVNHVVAAGNNGATACSYSPARVGVAISVGSVDNTDTRSSFSNIGPCVDLFAPGSNILSAWIGSTTATNTISGTSMASPHVAGAVAQFLGHARNVGDPVPPTPSTVEAFFKQQGTEDLLKNPGTGSPNILLFSPFSDV